MKVLIIQNKRIGDVLLSSIIAKNIKKNDPNSIIHFFCYDYATAVLENNEYIDKIISVNAGELKKFKTLLSYCKLIRDTKYDIIIDPYSKFQSKLMCYLSNAPIRVGNIRKVKKKLWKPYTHQVTFKKSKSLACGKSIEDRVLLLESVFPLAQKYYEPQIFFTDEELLVKKIEQPSIMIGVLGSVPSKSLPKETMAQLVDKVITVTDRTILFNYAPDQREDALAIYQLCEYKSKINFDLYESDLRQSLLLLNQCDLLISNEGGNVHMAKAIGVPTFTIYSPFINKESWNSFEDYKINESIHLRDYRPDLYVNSSREKLKEIERDPATYYNFITVDMIWQQLQPYIKMILK